MLSIGETTSSSLRRLAFLNRVLSATNSTPPCSYVRKVQYSTANGPVVPDSDKKARFVRIGNSIKEIKIAKSPEKVPRGYLSLYNGVLTDSQKFLRYLRWMMQKDELKQDSFLMGQPGAFRRHLAMSFAELTQREVEYLCLSRDTTESDIKQRREIIDSSVVFVNQCAVNAALNGRILIIEGIEKAERNLLPILNNLLENREINLDDGHFLVAPERYDKLKSLSSQSGNDLSSLNLLRVHEDFRVIAIGLPVPKYKGNSLDPPLRSRFQAHLVSVPDYNDLLSYLKISSPRVGEETLKKLCDFAYSFYQPEIADLNVLDFPIENLDKLTRIMNKCQSAGSQVYNESSLNLTSLLHRLYPHELILRDEETNKKFYNDLLQRFNLPLIDKNKTANSIEYKLVSVQDGPEKKLTFTNKSNNLMSIDLLKGAGAGQNIAKDEFIMNDYHSSQLVDMLLNHSSGHDFCLIGSQGCGKTELIKQFAKLLDYNMHTMYLYQDMSARELLQQRVTLENGDTRWQDSPLIEGALNGDLVVLDGIHRLKDDTIMSLRRLIQDRELDLLDGTKLLRHDRYDELVKEMQRDKNFEPSQLKIKRIHPSFRIIATGEPPQAQISFKESNETKNVVESGVVKSQPSAQQQQQTNRNKEWLNSEVLNLFLYQFVEPASIEYEYQILNKMFKMNKKHHQLLDLMEKLKKSGNEEAQIRHVAKLFSLRKLIRISKKLEQYPELSLKQLIENACLFKFMPQLNKQILSDFFRENELQETSTDSTNDDLIQKYQQRAAFEKETESEKDLSKLAKIPDTLFYENKLHTTILNNLIRDFELGEHLLLIGNQGTGKNKLVDKFLMLTKKTREYIQLHRDTTVHSLTVQPVIRSGVIHYEDSPLVKAVKEGHILVVDEADKAPLHVTSILKSLIETGEMLLSDGRRIVNQSYQVPAANSDKFIKMHKNFRMIILANRPGFPFLGNDFFAILGDLLSIHPVDNPDPSSEIEMLRMYAPNVSEKILEKLVSAFGSLRELSDQGLISYPYSTRELVNVVKHLEKFPNDSLSAVLANVYDFDSFADQSDLKSTFRDVMNKHGIPVGTNSFQISLAQPVVLPTVHKSHTIKPIHLETNSLVSSISDINWKPLSTAQVNKFKSDRKENRLNLFSELRTNWSLSDKQQIFSDLAVSKGKAYKNLRLIFNSYFAQGENGKDTVYIAGIKPMSIVKLDPETSECIEISLTDYFSGAWRSYFPRIKIHSVSSERDTVLVHEETSDTLVKIDFANQSAHQLERSVKWSSSLLNNNMIVNSARRAIGRYFVDQDQTHKLIPVNQNRSVFLSVRNSTGQLSLLDVASRQELTFNLESVLSDKGVKLKIFHVTHLGHDSVLIAGYDSNKVLNSDKLKLDDLVYLNLRLPRSETWSQVMQTEPTRIHEHFSLNVIDGQLFANKQDFLVNQIEITQSGSGDNQKLSELFQEAGVNKEGDKEFKPIIFPSVFGHANFMLSGTKDELDVYFSRRDTPIRDSKVMEDPSNFKIKSFVPVLKSVVNYDTNQVLTQLTRYSRPRSQRENLSYDSLGYLELVDLNQKNVRYLEIVKPTNIQNRNQAWQSYTHMSVINESEFMFAVSPNKQGNLYTLDFYGNLKEFETNHTKLERSLDEWQKLIMNRESQELKIETFQDSPNKELKEFKGPKHGKVDPKNAPHVGGNTWAGGSGGFDTAGLGGVGGPYRLSSGHQVFQVSDEMKQNVPEHVRRAAREMGEKMFRERLRDIQMSTFDYEMYTKYMENVKKPIQQLRNILDGLEAKKKERQWLKNQTLGDLDDTKLVEAIAGEKNVYRRRGDDPNADNSFNMEKPKRLKLVVDVSGSMYRFNGVDNRLERELESVLMVMESFKGYESKISYDVIGHSGDSFNIKFVDSETIPKNEAERLKILKTMIAHSQFCSSGDHTFEATKYAIQDLAKEEADDHIVIVLSDANFDRYGLSPRTFAKIMLDTEPKVNVFCIFIGTLGDQASSLKKMLPSNRAFVCMNTAEIPRIMQQIFQSAMLNN